MIILNILFSVIQWCMQIHVTQPVALRSDYGPSVDDGHSHSPLGAPVTSEDY